MMFCANLPISNFNIAVPNKVGMIKQKGVTHRISHAVVKCHI